MSVLDRGSNSESKSTDMEIPPDSWGNGKLSPSSLSYMFLHENADVWAGVPGNLILSREVLGGSWPESLFQQSSELIHVPTRFQGGGGFCLVFIQTAERIYFRENSQRRELRLAIS